MQQNKNTPSIRFAGFTGAWEQRRLGDFCKIDIGEFVIKTKQRDDAPYPVYNGGASYTGFYDEFNQDGKKVIISARGANAGFVNKCATPYWAGNSCYSIGVLDDTDWIFLYHAIKHVQLSFIKGQQSANIPSVSKEQVQKTEVASPNSQEQQKIATLLEDIDTLITLHQRKYDQLVNIKKSMLEKMFPKNGETVPEVRFAGFTDAWEQRKLGELCDIFRSGEFIKASDIYEDGAFPVYGGNGLRGYADRFNYDGNYALIGRQGALCGNMNFSSGKAYFTEHAVAVHANDNNNTRFLFYLLDTMNLGQYSAQSAQPGLAVNKLITLPALCPSKLEQETIAEFLTRIDDLITLHQRKLERLQNIKKACLEKMFV